jgi:tetratricopeptide (TPR) repeat protein
MARRSVIPDYGAHVPEDKDQLLVVTPYGEGLVVRTRKNAVDGRVQMREIELNGWEKAFESASGRPVRPTTLFSPTDFPSVTPTVGSDVLCLYGRGRVIEIRTTGAADHVVVVVRLSSWRLAHRSLVTCYLDISAVRMVRPKQTYEMSVTEKVERAMELKAEAAGQFTKKYYGTALRTYAKAVDAVKYVQHKPDSSNAVRADLLVVMITCSNNAATCCSKLEQWEEAFKHAQQAVALLDALETKKGSKIHQELQREGHHDVRLFGEWKVKSYLIIARALAEKDEIEAAMDVTKKAREVVVTYTKSGNYVDNAAYKQSIKQLLQNDKEFIKLYARCKERRNEIRKKEKLRAQAMFAAAVPPKEERVAEEKKSEPANASNETAGTATANDDVVSEEKGEAPRPVPKVVDTNDGKEEEVDLAWHKDPALLGGLGIILGTVGTLLLWSQLARRNS